MEYDHFQAAIRELSVQWLKLQDEDGLHNRAWQDVRLVKSRVQDGHFLRITALVSTDVATTRETDSWNRPVTDCAAPDSAEDEDEEALPRLPAYQISEPSHTLTYDIIHSPSYQAPVLYLYFEPSGCPGWLLKGGNEPAAGPMRVEGAVTLKDHPETGRPVFFVHPCRTQEAMTDVLGARKDVVAIEWLFIWFGIIGNAVGLYVPTELAVAVQAETSTS
ncbi:hypothetical protein BST61_g10112 [Cercospora zeina]